MTGMTRTTTRTARLKVPQGLRAVSTAFCVARPGTCVPGSSAFRAAFRSSLTTGTVLTGFVAWGNWVFIDPFRVLR